MASEKKKSQYRYKTELSVSLPLRCNRIEFIEEKHAWFGCARPLEQISNRLLAGTNVLIENLGALDTDEIQSAFPCHSRSQQCLATSGVSIEQEPIQRVSYNQNWMICIYPERSLRGDCLNIGPYLVGHSKVSRSTRRVS